MRFISVASSIRFALATLFLAAVSRGQCLEGEWYDLPPHNLITTTASQGVVPLCPGSSYSTGSWAQLFNPPQVPWKYTRICFAVGHEMNTTQTIRGEISIYGVTVDATSLELLPGERLATFGWVADVVPASDMVNSSMMFQSIDVSSAAIPLVAWTPGVFIGVSYWSCLSMWFATSSAYYVPGRLTFQATESGGWAQNEGSSGLSGDIRALTIRAVGEPFMGVPPEWSCAPQQFGDNETCNCYCGTWDIDCEKDPRSPDCPGNGVCDRTGRCVDLDWGTKCNVSHYGAYDGCQCECGLVVDTDCFDPFAAVNTCDVQPVSPRCAYVNNRTVCQERWTCDPDAYNNGSVCDCGCGVPDPDCDDPYLPNTCANDFQCINGQCLVPAGWFCSSIYYGAGDGCDCLCGAYDIDCDVDQVIFNCNNGQVCDYSGNCVASGCGNNVTEPWSQPPEQCDSGIGCSHDCLCLPGFVPKNPLRRDCTPLCNDGKVVDGEECDSGAFCTHTCMCEPGHEPYSPARTSCRGCGNGIIDANESCDLGTGCASNCSCGSGYIPTQPATPDCAGGVDADARKKIIIAACIGGGGGLILIGAVVCALFYARKVRYGPRKLNVPMELNMMGANSFVPSGAHDLSGVATNVGDGMMGSTLSPSSGVSSGTMVAVVASDGMVYPQVMIGGDGGVQAHMLTSQEAVQVAQMGMQVMTPEEVAAYTGSGSLTGGPVVLGSAGDPVPIMSTGIDATSPHDFGMTINSQEPRPPVSQEAYYRPGLANAASAQQ